MNLKKIVFWEPTLSPHKADLFAELSIIMPDADIVVCADRDISSARKSIGWITPKTIGYRVILAPDDETIRKLSCDDSKNSLHIFSGIRWVYTITTALSWVTKIRARYAIMSEPRVFSGFKGKVRLIQSLLTEKKHRQNAVFVLAIGRNGPRWFQLALYPSYKIFPFGYFVNTPRDQPSALSQSGTCRIGYLGRLVREKGIFDILDAAQLLGRDFKLEIAGAGRDSVEFEQRCLKSKVEVVLNGPIPNSEVSAFFARIDVLVLASTTMDDGWGVVVSEALMHGVAVVATDLVGASIMLDDPSLGRCIPARNPKAIAQAIRSLGLKDAFSSSARTRRAREGARIASASTGARHLQQIFQWCESGLDRPANLFENHEKV